MENKKVNELNDKEEEQEGVLDNFAINDGIKAKLRKRGIESLFPIQIKCFSHAIARHDIVAQARTGEGKTYAFGIPIVEMLERDFELRGHTLPQAFIMAPTRELAKQIADDLEQVRSNQRLRITAMYGQTPIDSQMAQLRRGVDILVGTPGRIKDLLERGALSLEAVRHVVLDECDRMLDMGFQHDVEHILSHMIEPNNNVAVSYFGGGEGDGANCSIVFDEAQRSQEAAANQSVAEARKTQPQVMLFSATMPHWVFQMARKYMQKAQPPEKLAETGERNLVHIRLVSGEEAQTARKVRHEALRIANTEEDRAAVIADLIRLHRRSRDARVIVFCEMKSEADELAVEPPIRALAFASPQRSAGGGGAARGGAGWGGGGCHVMHGGVAQATREIVLRKFREGKYSVLITTNVAARGLDIPAINLVIQCAPPRDVDDYIHRAGRTARAGKEGLCVCLYTPQEARAMANVERAAKIKFAHVGPPNQSAMLERNVCDQLEIAEQSGLQACDLLRNTSLARHLIELWGEEGAVARLAAKLCPKPAAAPSSDAHGSETDGDVTCRSLLTSKRHWKTYCVSYQADGGGVQPFSNRYEAQKLLERKLGADWLAGVTEEWTLSEDATQTLFDVSAPNAKEFEAAWKRSNKEDGELLVEAAEELPARMRFWFGGASSNEMNAASNGGGWRGRGGRGGGFRGRGAGRGGGFGGRGGSFRGGRQDWRQNGERGGSSGGGGFHRSRGGGFRGGARRGGRGAGQADDARSRSAVRFPTNS